MFDTERPFLRFVREERVFCAALAHLLMVRGPNLSIFIELLNAQLPAASRLSAARVSEAEVYLEFTYLRDDWYALRRNNEEKRRRLLQLFARVPSLRPLANVPWPAEPASLNARFAGMRGERITQDVVYPAQWTLPALAELSTEFRLGADGFRALCMVKWAFNIKPDLVVLLPDAPPVCIEAKLESRESTYPTVREECVLFDSWGDPRHRVGQVELQQFMFDSLLQTPCQPVVVGRSAFHRDPEGGTGAVPFLAWAEVFAALDSSSSIGFVHRLLSENEIVRRALRPGR